MAIVNIKLMANPLNWVTLALWLFAIGFFAHIMGLTTVATAPPTPLPPTPSV